MSKDTLKEERLKVLELLSQGKISADDAERLLDALQNEQPESTQAVLVNDKKKPFRMLKVSVDSEDGDKVRVQIPIEFAKLLKKGRFNIDLDEYDIDIDDILKIVESGAMGELINITTEDGAVVKITIE